MGRGCHNARCFTSGTVTCWWHSFPSHLWYLLQWMWPMAADTCLWLWYAWVWSSCKSTHQRYVMVLLPKSFGQLCYWYILVFSHVRQTSLSSHDYVLWIISFTKQFMHKQTSKRGVYFWKVCKTANFIVFAIIERQFVLLRSLPLFFLSRMDASDFSDKYSWQPLDSCSSNLYRILIFYFSRLWMWPLGWNK